MTNRHRITVSENIIGLSLHDMSLQAFRDLDAKYGDDYLNLRIHGEEYGYDGAANYYLRGDRQENDQEYAIRIADEDRAKELEKKLNEKKRLKELTEYERLKKKYG
jgi:hypothetical protein